MAGAVTNIILDPVMIYGLLEFPEMGVKGAAWATVAGQVVSLLIGMFFHFKKDKEIPCGIKYLKPDIKIIGVIYSIGFPAIVAQAIMSVMTYGLNLILVKIGEAYVTAYGLYYKVQQFVLFCAFGLRDAIMPIVAFNFGKEDRQRVSDGVKYGILYALVIMVIGLLLLEAFAFPLSKVFGLSGMTENLCVSAMRIISVGFLFAGSNIAFQGVFQALGDGLASLVISLLRQFVLVLPVAYFLSKLVIAGSFPSWSVWTTFIFAEGVSLVAAIVMFRRLGFHMRKIFKINYFSKR